MIFIYIALSLLLVTAYAGLLIYIIHIWNGFEDYSDPEALRLNAFTVIIPARNEAGNLSQCLETLIQAKAQYTGNVQIIVVDDHSDDDTVLIAKNYAPAGVEVILLSEHIDAQLNAYKKQAIQLAIRQAQHGNIIQLDADIELKPAYFIKVNAALENTQAHFLAAPVHFKGEGVLGVFQQLDMVGMMGVTAAGIESKNWFMANGANMIYKKTELDYKGEHLASGDDIYTVQKFNTEGKTIHFLKNPEAAVQTKAEDTLLKFYRQRIRWATKNKRMESFKMQLMMVIPFFNALMLLAHLVLIFWMGELALMLFSFHFALKGIYDYVYLKKMSMYFGLSFSFFEFMISSLLNPLYLSIIGLLSLVIRKYEWKGREVV